MVMNDFSGILKRMSSEKGMGAEEDK